MVTNRPPSKLGGDGEKLARQTDGGIVLRPRRRRLGKSPAQAGHDQKQPHQVQQPVEGLQQGGAGSDHHAAHQQRAHDPPAQDPVLMLGRHAEGGKDDGHGQDVVQRKGKFHQVAGQELQRFLPAAPLRQQAGKKQRQQQPKAAPQQRLAHFHHAGRAMEQTQVQRHRKPG
jgi:hypothetical protein